MEKNLKVLIVEDEAIVAANLSMQLRKMNFNVISSVGKGEKAVDKALAEKPDIILMDIVLSSNMNGLEAARKILACYNPLIIFISGFIDENISKEIDSLNAYKLYKPFRVSDIVKIVERIINLN